MKATLFTATLAIATSGSGTMAQQAKPFGPSPVPCNSQGFSNCMISFDGNNATRTYMHVRGGQTRETHNDCTSSGRKISCPPGTWTTDKGFSGNAETLTITLDAAGKAKSTGH